MERDRQFDDVLRKKISETLDEQIDESIDADDLMFDLGMRYLRMMSSEKKKAKGRIDQFSLWTEDSPSKKALIEYVKAIRRAAEYYSLPLLDLYACSGLQPTVPVIAEKYCPDGLHPNKAGYTILSRRIKSFLESL